MLLGDPPFSLILAAASLIPWGNPSIHHAFLYFHAFAHGPLSTQNVLLLLPDAPANPSKLFCHYSFLYQHN
jgi:hypothetical protein